MTVDAELAARVAATMLERDEASRALGMRIESATSGQACITMSVRRDMINGHQTCHGGFIFALADTAFAFACNSRNEAAVAASCHIDYLLPAREGDRLRAEATERAAAGRSGFYDVSVVNGNGELIALFRGRSHKIKGEVLSPADVADLTDAAGKSPARSLS